MISVPRFAGLIAVSAILVGTACASSTDDGDSGSQDITSAGGNAFDSGDCRITSKLTGQALTKDDISKLGDPIAKKILLEGGGFGCPQTFSGIQEKLRTTDANKCAVAAGKPPPGVSTRFVSDRAQLLGKADDAAAYRGVVTRQCDGRTDHELFISIFGVAGGDHPAVPADVEMIGEDKTRGVFNFYTRENDEWTFHGSSEDFVKSGYNCNADGACVPKVSDKARCASCHVGGGLIMKELASPWSNWEGDTTTPGLDKLFSTFPSVLGTRGNGIDLESKVEQANQSDWVPHRIDLLAQMGTEDLLRPLFCSTDMNLQADGQQKSALSQVSGGFFVDPHWQNGFTGVPVDAGLYAQKLAAHKARISSSQGSSLGTDTFFAFTHPQRSHQDKVFIETLVSRGILDEDFVKDVLNVDFTRPLYSAERCGLLKFAPKLSAAQLTAKGQAAASIRAGFVANLAGQSGAAATLATNLGNTSDSAAHETAVQQFFAACAKRPKDQMIDDIITFNAHLINQVKKVKGGNGQGIIEFAETLPASDIGDSPLGFDPVTCARTLQ